MNLQQIPFRLISDQMGAALCTEYHMPDQNFNAFAQYRSAPFQIIDNMQPPAVSENVRGDGNCMYRAVSLAISGSEENYIQLKQLTASELDIHRYNFDDIGDNEIDNLIKRAKAPGRWGEESHLIALSVALRIRIYVFNHVWNPPRWDTMSTSLHHVAPVQADFLAINNMQYIFIL